MAPTEAGPRSAAIHGPSPRPSPSSLKARREFPAPSLARNPAAASLYIVPGLGSGDSLFSTHPATENRIAALEAIADELGVHSPPPVTDRVTRSRASALDPLGRRS